MCITTGDLDHFNRCEKVDKPWSRLVGVALNVGGKIFHGRQAELTARACTPRINIAFDIYCDCVPVTTSNLVDAFVTQLLDFQRIGLQMREAMILY